MIIAKLVGGLGNQFFQYAIARNIANKNNLELKLDLRAFETYRRPYFLNRFNIIENTLSQAEAEKYDVFTKKYSLAWLKNKLTPLEKRIYRQESPSMYYKYFPALLKVNTDSDAVVDGFWQNEKYFLEIRDILLQEFTLKDEFDFKTKEIYNKINNNESVSIHFRRGDNVAKPEYGVPPIEYYQKGVETIAAKVKNPHFFIFSDEISWVEENFKIEYPITFVSVNESLKDYQELIAMSLCKHNIIANSTFSWWGAWLNNNKSKIVIAPKKFFTISTYDTKELYPEAWLKF